LQKHAEKLHGLGEGDRPSRATDKLGSFRWMKMENVMKNLLLAAAAATMVFAVAPAFAASPADDAEQGYSVYPSAGTCHFVKQQVVLPNGHVIFQTHQLCN
jgi:hypothetical protein